MVNLLHACTGIDPRVAWPILCRNGHRRGALNGPVALRLARIVEHMTALSNLSERFCAIQGITLQDQAESADPDRCPGQWRLWDGRSTPKHVPDGRRAAARMVSCERPAWLVDPCTERTDNSPVDLGGAIRTRFRSVAQSWHHRSWSVPCPGYSTDSCSEG